MKIYYQIEHQDMGGWQPSHCELADGVGQLARRMKQMPGILRYHTQYAIMTQADLQAMQGYSARQKPFYDETCNLHFDGHADVFTEWGMREIPFVVCDADCYKTGAGETPDILTILQELEDFLKKHEQEAHSSDWAIRMCQAIVAHAGGFESRYQWTDQLRTRNRVASLSGMKELFKFDWTNYNRCLNDYIQEWCKKNSVEWHYNNQQMELKLDELWMRCGFVNDGDHCTVFCSPAPAEELAEQPGMRLS